MASPIGQLAAKIQLHHVNPGGAVPGNHGMQMLLGLTFPNALRAPPP
jgi:hypothetical protein